MTVRILTTTTPVLLAAILAGPPVRAQTSADRSDATASKLKSQRDPFTPIGYVEPTTDSTPAVVPTAPQTPATVVNWPELQVTAIILSPEGRVASIVGVGVAKQGQVIAKDVSGIRYTWRIDEITKKTIVPTRLAAKRIR